MDPDELIAPIHVGQTQPQQLPARAPVLIANASTARSRSQRIAANSSFQRSSGSARGRRLGTFGL